MNQLRARVADSAAAIDADETEGVERHTKAIEAAKKSLASFNGLAEELGPKLAAVGSAVTLSSFEQSQFRDLATMPTTVTALKRAASQAVRVLEKRLTSAKRDLNAFLEGIKKRREALDQLDQELTARDEQDLERFHKLLERSGMVIKTKGSVRA
jgi:hypothetical protein